MSKTILKISAQLMRADRKGNDSTMNLKFNTREASSEELAIWDTFRSTTGWVVFSPDNIQEEDIPVEDTEFQTKTPSQRLRGVLFIKWTQEGERGVFDDYYRTEMEKLINHYKNKLN